MFLPGQVAENARTPKAEGLIPADLRLELVASREAAGVRSRIIDAILWALFCILQNARLSQKPRQGRT